MWQFHLKTNILFKEKILAELSAHLPEGRGFLITSPSFVRKGIAKQCLATAQGKLVVIYSDVPANPTISACQSALNAAKAIDADFVVALGGGSVMDLAKIVACGLGVNTSVKEWFDGAPLPSESVPLIAIPTTAGTGSEVTSVAVLSDDIGGIKKPLSSIALVPQSAYIDPTLTLSVPPYITACTGFDVIAHALEAYWSKGHQPICDALAIQALQRVLTHLLTAYHHPENLDARTALAEASLLAGIAFSLPKTAAAHALSYPLTHHHHIPHGEACALSLEYWLRYNAEENPERYDALAKQLNFENVEALACHLTSLKEELGLRTTLKDLHLNADEQKRILREAQNPTLQNNPRPVTEAVLKAWLETML